MARPNRDEKERLRELLRFLSLFLRRTLLYGLVGIGVLGVVLLLTR